MTPNNAVAADAATGAPAAGASGMDPLPRDHAGLAVLPFETCMRLIAQEQVGRVAFVADGEIVVLPVNYVVDGQGVAFRVAVGSKLSAAAERGVVAFEVDRHDPATRRGWSVLLNGTAETVTDDADVARLERTGLASWADAADRPHWVRIRPNSVTGRAIARPRACLPLPQADAHERALRPRPPQ